jgi:hypothetical protein
MYSHIHFYTVPATHTVKKKNMFPETRSVNLSGWRHHTSSTHVKRVQTYSLIQFQLTYGSYHASDIHKLHMHAEWEHLHWNRFSSLTMPAIATVSIRVVGWEHLHWNRFCSLTVPAISIISIRVVRWEHLHWNRFCSLTVPAISTISIRVVRWEHLHWNRFS